MVVTDPKADGHGPGDIRGLRLDHTSTGFLLQIRTQRPTDIEAAPAWTNKASITSLRFNIDIFGSAAFDNVVLLTPGPSGPTIEFQSIAQSPSPRVDCVAVSQPQLTLIRVRVEAICVDDDATTARAFARYVFDTGGNGSINSDDRAPDQGYSPRVTFAES